MGLHVDAIRVDDKPDKMDSMLVSTAPRTVELRPCEVGPPLERTQVVESVEGVSPHQEQRSTLFWPGSPSS